MAATAILTIPDALVALFGGALDADVVDAYTFAASDGNVFTVGPADPSDETGSPSVSSTQELLDGYGNDRHEFLRVPCRLEVPAHETPADARAALLVLLTAAGALLRADRTLGGLVQEAHFGDTFDLFMADGSSGDRARLDLIISADLYTN